MALNQAIDITYDQRKTLVSLLSRHLPDTEAWAYGSRVKGTGRPASDLDMVVFTAPEQARAVSDLRESLEESSLPFRVDLFVWDEVPESFREQIKREHAVLAQGTDSSVSLGGFA
ncbi:MAG: nucleotidyltransferase domain-containing protein [Gammaproteobacteria bacterium]|nr:nucleotidyltransferase domain-containing protein [Gammaproteobacteria bacterium]MCY4256461.1 nucleotidyltransferase domain-containing protein [Gammaproteobacteria bacterium]MCY4340620.1 nucleotidyltransferase domain-containing protein [Gammaproteobacteria bacterium]